MGICHCSAKDANSRGHPSCSSRNRVAVIWPWVSSPKGIRWKSRASGHSKTCLFTSLLFSLALEFRDFWSKIDRIGRCHNGSPGITREALDTASSSLFRRPWDGGRTRCRGRGPATVTTRLTVSSSNTLSPNLGPWICSPWQELWKDLRISCSHNVCSFIYYSMKPMSRFISWYDRGNLWTNAVQRCIAGLGTQFNSSVSKAVLKSWAKLCSAEHQNSWCIWNLCLSPHTSIYRI